MRDLATFRWFWQWMRRKAPSRSAAFVAIYKLRYWGKGKGEDSVSGSGSNLDATRLVRPALEQLVRELDLRSILDAPCGDLFWIREVNLGTAKYTGADIVPPLIKANQKQYPDRRFVVLDLVTDRIEPFDLILCRDCMVHLPCADVARALANISASGSKYLLATTFPDVQENTDLERPGQWRAINLQRPPFNLPPPERMINEGVRDPAHASKSLGLWRLPLAVGAARP